MKTRPNQEIRDTLKLYGFTQWDLCKALGIGETTLYRRLRDELPEDQKLQLISILQWFPMSKSGLVLFALKEWELLDIETSK